MNRKHKPPKLALEELIRKMNTKQAEVCLRIYKDYFNTISIIPGGMNKHHTWRGGYISHMEEAMNIAIALYESLNRRRQLDFSLSDVLFCLFLHDFDKVLRFKKTSEGFIAESDYNSNYPKIIRNLLNEKYDYTLSGSEYNAIKYTHGEGGDYHPSKRVMKPLAALVHCCDIISARIWFDEGKESNKW